MVWHPVTSAQPLQSSDPKPALEIGDGLSKAWLVPENPATERTSRGGIGPILSFPCVSGKVSLFAGGVLVTGIVGHAGSPETGALDAPIVHFKVRIELLFRPLGFHDFDEAFHSVAHST